MNLNKKWVDPRDQVDVKRLIHRVSALEEYAASLEKRIQMAERRLADFEAIFQPDNIRPMEKR